MYNIVGYKTQNIVQENPHNIMPNTIRLMISTTVTVDFSSSR